MADAVVAASPGQEHLHRHHHGHSPHQHHRRHHSEGPSSGDHGEHSHHHHHHHHHHHRHHHHRHRHHSRPRDGDAGHAAGTAVPAAPAPGPSGTTAAVSGSPAPKVGPSPSSLPRPKDTDSVAGSLRVREDTFLSSTAQGLGEYHQRSAAAAAAPSASAAPGAATAAAGAAPTGAGAAGSIRSGPLRPSVRAPAAAAARGSGAAAAIAPSATKPTAAAAAAGAAAGAAAAAAAGAAAGAAAAAAGPADILAGLRDLSLKSSPVLLRARMGKPVHASEPRDLLVGVGGAPTSLAKAVARRAVPVGEPKAAGAFRKRTVHSAVFRKMYERGDLPVRVIHGTKRALKWTVEPSSLDYTRFLPVFFDGLAETEEPMQFVALQGTLELLEHSTLEQVLSSLPALIMPIRNCLNSRDPVLMVRMLKVLQKLVTSSEVGIALVPYYRQILPILNMFKTKNLNTGDGMVYTQHEEQYIGDLIEDLLKRLEHFGGENAYINIKYMVPTYEGSATWQPPGVPPEGGVL